MLTYETPQLLMTVSTDSVLAQVFGSGSFSEDDQHELKHKHKHEDD